MDFLPSKGAAWGRLVLLPFKVYVFAAWVGERFYVHAAGRQIDSNVGGCILVLYLICFVILLTGGVVQRVCGQRVDSTGSFLAAGLAALICWALVPVLSGT